MGGMTPPLGSDVAPYDALLLLSFGGPEKAEDVVPFLENVTRGRGIPRERLEEVGQHYFGFGGKSPINDQNRALLAAVRADLAAAGVNLPVYWGNRNWDPYLNDAVEQMKADGVTRAAVFTTSAYSSYSSCRQYRENLYDARAAVDGAPRLERLRQYYNHPGFVEPFVDATLTCLADLPDEVRGEARLVFVTHSIPTAMNDGSGAGGGAYLRQHESVMAVVAQAVAAQTGTIREHELVFCSRSGAPHVPWLEPDVNDRLEELAGQGVRAVVMVPIGFVSDHMEVVYDLDTEAMATAERLGLQARRAATPGTDPRFVAMVRDLVLERAAAERGEAVTRTAVGSLGAGPDLCVPGCCPNPRGPRPALCGRDSDLSDGAAPGAASTEAPAGTTTQTATRTPSSDVEALDPVHLRDVAVRVATAAANLVREFTAGVVSVADTKSSAVDVVTEADRRAEELVRRLLAEERPDDAVLGEEEGARAGTSGVRWVVDPVDGTVNLLYGLEEFAVSLAAEVDGESLAAAVVEVTSGTVYAAARGLGATRNGVPLQVRASTTLEQSLVLTGFGYRSEVRAHQGRCVAELLPRVRDIRRLGSCALDLCHVAEGRADGYVEDGPRVWDYAAGRLVLTEAGGRFAIMRGPLSDELEDWDEESVLVAAPEASFDQFTGLLRECGFIV